MLPSENCDSSSIKIDLEDKNKIENTQSHIEKEENVALNVEGVPTIEDDNGLNPKADSENSPINNSLNIYPLSSISNISDISSLNDGEDNNEDGGIIRS